MDIVTIDGIPVYQALVDSADTGMMRISLVDDPAVQSDFLAFANQKPARVQMYAVQDEEKRLVLGVVMRADFPIYRRSGDGFEYYIVYKADTIRTMAEKYLSESRQNLVNLDHEEGTDQEGVQMVQYFIKGAGLNPEGFDGIADGSLFAEFHITNDEVWNAVKAGTYKGFSLEGVFDLVPERNEGYVEGIVDALDGLFSRIFNNKQKYQEMKTKGILARLAAAIAEEAARTEVEMGNVTTDKGVLSWDGEEDLKAGDAVFTVDADGNKAPAADGDYKTEDGKTIIVVDGKVSEINDGAAEVAPAEDFGKKATDKGDIEWDGDEDLKAGDAVYVTDEEGNRVAAPDGEYVTEDGKTIVVVDGKVSEIKDPKAEVAPAAENAFARVAVAMQETYDEKIKKLYDAIVALGFNWPWLEEAGEEFVIASIYTDRGEKVYYRFNIAEWNEEGFPVLEDGVKVVPAFVTPEEKETIDASFAALKSENETLKAEVARLSAIPAAKPAHETFEGQGEVIKTGNKGLDRLARLVTAK